MPDYTVSADVDSMLRSANDAAIRSAIGVGTTDAPTFLAQTLTGQSLTGTQATSLVDLSATWNTTGTPSALKLNVTDTASNAASKLLDLQVGGVSLVSVEKNGTIAARASSTSTNTNPTTAPNGITFAGSNGKVYISSPQSSGNGLIFWQDNGAGTVMFVNNQFVRIQNTTLFQWCNADSGLTPTLSLAQDAPGILAQRNGDAAQAFRLYNTYTNASNYQRLSFGFASGVAQILSSGAGTSGHAALTLGTGSGTWQFTTAGNFIALADNAYDIGASGANRPKSIYVVNAYPSNIQLQSGAANYGWIGLGGIFAPSNGVFRLTDSTGVDFSRLQLGGTTSAFPAIKRSGTGIHIVLADDSTFAPVKGKLTTDTNYTAGVPSATGYLTIYDATGTAYRVPCTV